MAAIDRNILRMALYEMLHHPETPGIVVINEALELARRTLKLLHDQIANPSMEPKVIPTTRRTRGHSMAMIQVNTLQVLRLADPDPAYDRMIDASIDEVFRYFVHPEKKALFETVGTGGELLLDLLEGRCINPGHAIDPARLVMEVGGKRVAK